MTNKNISHHSTLEQIPVSPHVDKYWRYTNDNSMLVAYTRSTNYAYTEAEFCLKECKAENLISTRSHLWGTCACPCQCQRTWRLQTGRSWCWPAPQHSACHAVHQQTQSYSGPNAGQGSAHSYCRRSPRGSPAPVTEKGQQSQESVDR